MFSENLELLQYLFELSWLLSSYIVAFLGTDAHKSEIIILDYRNNISRKRTTI